MATEKLSKDCLSKDCKDIGQIDAKASSDGNLGQQSVVTTEMITAGALVIADAFDLEIGGYRAESVAEDVISAALAAIAKTR